MVFSLYTYLNNSSWCPKCGSFDWMDISIEHTNTEVAVIKKCQTCGFQVREIYQLALSNPVYEQQEDKNNPRS